MEVRSTNTYCNPVNLPYYLREGEAGKVFREAADPSLVFHEGRYWLFPSKCKGYYHSTDLVNWTHVESRNLPVEDYAPDVRVIDGKLHFTASRNFTPNRIYRSGDPAHDVWEMLAEPPLQYGDPNLFQDDDERVYLYWGCSNFMPICGVEMDRRTWQPIGERVELIHGHAEEHGWERHGDKNAGGEPPWIEGAWMTKHAGRYYLQYAAPGTQFDVYGDGVYVADRPLGPFAYAPHNPFSFKPGGFITGAGHGSTFPDRFDNLWHISTMRISVRHMFERRLGIFPAGFDAEGNLFCNMAFSDYPTHLPTGKWDPWRDSFTGWMLLSYRKAVRASSALPGHPAEQVCDEDVRTYWSAATGEAGEWLEMDLGAMATLRAVQINFAEHECRMPETEEECMGHQYLLETSEDGQSWRTLCDKRTNREDVPHDYVELAEPVSARYLRLTNRHMPASGTFALSGLRVFGLGAEAAPQAVEGVRATRDAKDPLTAHVTWQPAARATGYVVRWGMAPEKLYNSFMVYDQTELELRALDRDARVWLAVDAFGEGGVTVANSFADC